MKRTPKTLYAAIVIVATTAAFLIGCKKDDSTTTAADTPTADELARGEATLAKIMDFKQQVDYYQSYPDVKDGTTMSIDEAIWNIEALFNLTYSYPELSYGRTVTADTILYLPLQADNTVLLTELTVFYGQMYEVISDIYHGIDLDNKQFIILDVELGEWQGSQQAIRLQSIQGSAKGIQPPTPQPVVWAPFAYGPAWCYGEDGGRTDGSFSFEMDAADTLANMLNATLVAKAPVGQEYIYTEIMMKELPYEMHPSFSHNLYQGEYYEFYVQDAAEEDKWLSTSQMNFQYYGERHLVLNVLRDYDDGIQSPVPSNFKFFNVTIEDYHSSSDQDLTIGHHTKAYYGQRETIYYNIIVKDNL